MFYCECRLCSRFTANIVTNGREIRSLLQYFLQRVQYIFKLYLKYNEFSAKLLPISQTFVSFVSKNLNPIDMKSFTEMSWPIFNEAIADYHKTDNVDTPINNPYPVKSIEYYLYLKCWIDTVQWHFEDIIRDPNIDPVEALTLKRRIDKSNQDRTDLVELIDSYFLDTYKDVTPAADATINTESPAWAVDRYSILSHRRRCG